MSQITPGSIWENDNGIAYVVIAHDEQSRCSAVIKTMGRYEENSVEVRVMDRRYINPIKLQHMFDDNFLLSFVRQMSDQELEDIKRAVAAALGLQICSTAYEDEEYPEGNDEDLSIDLPEQTNEESPEKIGPYRDVDMTAAIKMAAEGENKAYMVKMIDAEVKAMDLLSADKFIVEEIR